MAGSEGRYSSSRDEGVRSRDRKNSAHRDRDRDRDRDRHRHRHREYKSHRDYCDESSCGKCKYSEDERVRETENEKEKKRRWSDHHMKREQTSPKQLKQHEQSNLSDLVPGSISKSHGCFKYSEHEMVTETETEREKKQRRRSDQNTNTKRELTSPKQELKKQQSNHSDLLPVSISPEVTAIEKREDKVQRTGWDQLPTIDLTAEKPIVPEEGATKYLVLTDMFDPEIEEQSELYLDIRDEIQEECCKIGAVVDDIHLNRKTGGLCIRFDNNRSAAVAKKKFHEWERRGKSIKATYLEEERYRKSLSGPIMDADVPPTAGSLLLTQVNVPLVTEDPPSECLVLKNVFDGSVEKWPEFYLDVKDLIHEQCAQFGPVQHIHVDKNLGYVYLRFDSKRTSTVAHKAFHGSSFDGRLITATFMSSRLYDSMFPDFWA